MSANRNLPKADGPNGSRGLFGLRRLQGDPTTVRCRVPSERGRDPWHCLAPTNCVFRRWPADWMTRCCSRSPMRDH
jgi:hypothetical protein